MQESKERRKAGSLPAIPTRFWLWTLTVLVAWAIFYWRQTQGEIESQKAALFAKQRGVVAELGARFDPLRQRIEDWTTSASGAFQGELVAPELLSYARRDAELISVGKTPRRPSITQKQLNRLTVQMAVLYRMLRGA